MKVEVEVKVEAGKDGELGEEVVVEMEGEVEAEIQYGRNHSFSLLD